MLRVCLAAVLTALPAAAWATQGGLPKGPAPKLMVALVDDQGRPILLKEVVEMVAVQRKVTVQVNNRNEERTVTEHVPVQRTVPFDLGKARIFDATGKALEPKEAGKRIKGATAVLVSADGKPVDPFYLRLARPETLVVVSPELTRALVPPAALPVPPPPAIPVPGKN
jgi:hypothetical protein